MIVCFISHYRNPARSLVGKAIVAAALILGSAATLANTLVMVSVDGLRWDYPERHGATHLQQIAAQGLRVNRLEPVYPSKTFPGHLSLITGLLPVDHGIVDNHFCDQEREQCYSMGDGGKDSTWIKGVPLWNLVESYGHKAATFFWPESDARIGGMVPSYHYHYAKPARYTDRVEQVLAWLDQPEASRPTFITLYFSKVDTMGHRHGPDAEQTVRAMQEVDQLIGDLWAGIQQRMASRGEAINLLVVSDHGMAEIRGEAVHVLDEVAPEMPGYIRQNGHTRVAYYPDPAFEGEALTEDQLLARLQQHAPANARVLSRKTLQTLMQTEQAHRPELARLPVAAVETSPPAYFTSRVPPKDAVGGAHGYPVAANDSMHALLIGAGPAFTAQTVIERAHQLDVYPLAAAILGLPPLGPLASDGGELLRALKQHSTD